MVHRPTICNKSYRSHEKEKEQCILFCIVLNFSVSKLPNLPYYFGMHLPIVGSHKNAFAIWNLENRNN